MWDCYDSGMKLQNGRMVFTRSAFVTGSAFSTGLVSGVYG